MAQLSFVIDTVQYMSFFVEMTIDSNDIDNINQIDAVDILSAHVTESKSTTTAARQQQKQQQCRDVHDAWRYHVNDVVVAHGCRGWTDVKNYGAACGRVAHWNTTREKYAVKLPKAYGEMEPWSRRRQQFRQLLHYKNTMEHTRRQHDDHWHDTDDDDTERNYAFFHPHRRDLHVVHVYTRHVNARRDGENDEKRERCIW
jgi:hypothetical protein